MAQSLMAQETLLARCPVPLRFDFWTYSLTLLGWQSPARGKWSSPDIMPKLA